MDYYGRLATVTFDSGRIMRIPEQLIFKYLPVPVIEAGIKLGKEQQKELQKRAEAAK